MGKYNIHTNAVSKESSRLVHLEVMKAVSEIIMQTAGPRGSTTMIVQENGSYPMYSKDGKKVLEHVDVYGQVEKGILDQLIQITEKVVGRVGDGTTSAVRLSYLVFKELVDMEKRTDLQMNSYDIIDHFHKATKCITECIETKGRDLNIKDIYDICMISTNGNEELSTIISDIYAKYGTAVYIDLKTSSTSDYMTKEYDGLTINKGYASSAFVNGKNGICTINKPNIYVFKDPVDTPEMIGYFTRILYENITNPYQHFVELNKLVNNHQLLSQIPEKELEKMQKDAEMVPTVIMLPFLSRDTSNTLEVLELIMRQYDKDMSTMAQKPPVVIINELTGNIDELSDVSTLCGCKVIGKYIDETVQKVDIESGMAPTLDNVVEFCGSAEQVIVYKDKTKFINPSKMFNLDENDEAELDDKGERVYSNTYVSLVSFLKNALEESIADGESPVEINRLKRRLNGLSSTLVELYIGGISVTDRESLKDLADDAIRNCRSAANKGVGRAANFEGFTASSIVALEHHDTTLGLFANIIKDAYVQVLKDLYAKSMPADKVDDELQRSIDLGGPINLRTLNYDNNVLTSIDTDIAILDCISRIVTIMFTSNQILVTNAFGNEYASLSENDTAPTI